MPIGQAQDMLTQLMQQLMSGGFAQQSSDQLGQMGAGKINAKKMFREDPATEQMRQAVMSRVLGYYGGGGMSGGNPIMGGMLPDTTIGGGMQPAVMPKTGITTGGGFQFPGYEGGLGATGGSDILTYGGQPSDTIAKGMGNPNVGDAQLQDAMSGQGYRPFPNGASSVDDMISQLWSQQGGQGQQALNPQQQQQQAQQSIFQGAGALPELGGSAQNQLNQMFQPQMDQMNMDFDQQKTGMLESLFGKGMAQSTPATDAAGKLLYGRSSAMNQITGQKAQAELQMRQQLMDQLSKMNPNQLSAMSGGGGGGGMVPPNAYGGTQDGALTSAIMGQMQGMDRPMNFDQAMQMKKLQLDRDQLTQQGQLGFGGLDLQRLLGLGSQGLQQQGMGQDLMMQMLGLQQQGRQSQAGLASSEAARLQQFLLGQQGMQAGIGQQQAQMEAQKKSLLSSILSGVLGGGLSLAGSALTGGIPIGSMFGGGH